MILEEKSKKTVTVDTEVVIKKFCCRKMKQIFSNKYKMSYSDRSGVFWNAFHISKTKTLNIPIRHGCDGVTEREPIKYCPFCGEEVVVE